MTPSQMLKRLPPKPPEELSPITRQAVDHVVKIISPPVTPGRQITRSSVEPWIIEQIDKLRCPECTGTLLHMCAVTDTNRHYYTCEENPAQHRWTLTE